MLRHGILTSSDILCSVCPASAPYHCRLPPCTAQSAPVKSARQVDADRRRAVDRVGCAPLQAHRPCSPRTVFRAVNEFGQQWERISEIVGRMAGDCRDRWRNHLEDRGRRRTGPWSKEEEEELTRIVTEMTVEQGRDIDSEVFWGIVSQRMGARRGRQQCRIKWCVVGIRHCLLQLLTIPGIGRTR